MAKAHPGFNNVADSIEKKEGVSKGAADAILASSSHNASKKAKKKNPNLKKVGGNPFANAMSKAKK